MIRITMFKNKENNWVGFRCRGHAGFDQYGKDIICSAVSILAINLINSIEQLTSDRFSVAEDKKGELKFLIPEGSSKEAQLLLSSFRLGITGIEEQYGSKFLKLNDKEV